MAPTMRCPRIREAHIRLTQIINGIEALRQVRGEAERLGLQGALLAIEKALAEAETQTI